MGSVRIAGSSLHDRPAEKYKRQTEKFRAVFWQFLRLQGRKNDVIL